MQRVRKRKNLVAHRGNYWRVTNDSSQTRHSSQVLTTEYEETQHTVSEDHHWPPRKKGFKRDIGGEFFTEKRYLESPHDGGQRFRLKGRQTLGPSGGLQSTEWYDGPITLSVPAAHRYPTNTPMSNDDMDEYGATAVARCKPTNSAADVGVLLGELLREGLPRFGPSNNWSRRIEAAKAAGDDYLNYQFGWKPLLNELGEFKSAVDKSYAALQQLRRDDGRLIRRRYSFPTERTVTEVTNPNGAYFIAPGLPDFINSNGALTIRKEESIRKMWFSGAFRYHLPDHLKGESGLEELRAMAETNFGLTMSPSLIWELAPWSWAVDWFTNTGDVISNISDSQKYGLIMPYGYMMVHTIKKYTFSSRGVTFKSSPGVPQDLVFVSEVKQRRKANPFGFGVSDSDLDLTQISILAALGLTRGR